jgi:hypothetical protein
LFVAKARRLATLRILLTVREDEVTIQRKIVVPSYQQLAKRW